jgi:hypothetical protein
MALTRKPKPRTGLRPILSAIAADPIAPNTPLSSERESIRCQLDSSLTLLMEHRNMQTAMLPEEHSRPHTDFQNPSEIEEFQEPNYPRY